MSLFATIEERHGVDQPGYEPPPEPDFEPEPYVTKPTLELWEAVLCVGFPVFGIGRSIWRFGRGDVGPGVAALMLSAVGWIAGWLLLGMA